MSRPSGYRAEFCEKLIEYFSVTPYREESPGSLVPNDFPTFAGFAAKIGVHRETLLEWSKLHPEFSDAYKRAKDFQENYLAVNGTKGLINAAFGIFTAKNVLGWRDKRDTEVTVTNLANQTDEQLETRIEELLKKVKGNEPNGGN